LLLCHVTSPSTWKLFSCSWRKIGHYGCSDHPPDGEQAMRGRGMPLGPTNLTAARAIRRETRTGRGQAPARCDEPFDRRAADRLIKMAGTPLNSVQLIPATALDHVGRHVARGAGAPLIAPIRALYRGGGPHCSSTNRQPEAAGEALRRGLCHGCLPRHTVEEISKRTAQAAAADDGRDAVHFYADVPSR
jgi:hypothetical protein